MTKEKPEVGALKHLWKSPWTSWVGLRYLKSKKNSRFLSFITYISITGVTLGVTAMIVVLSVMDGFEEELKKRLMSSDLHILITPTTQVAGFDQGFVPKSAFDNTLIGEQIKNDKNVIDAWAVVSTEAVLKTGKKVSGIVLKGVSTERIGRLRKQLTESADPQMMIQKEGSEVMRLPSIFIGQELAYEMGIIPGDQVTLVSPTEMEGPLDAIPRIKRFAVEGIYKSGLPEQELQNVFAADSSIRSFLRKQDVVSHWEVTVKDFEKAPALASRIRSVADGFKVQDWIQLNSHLFASLKLERIAMFVILAFIIIVASFNIVTTLTMMVLEKKKEIAILKAMGARQSEIAAIFLSEGLLIGGIGVILGVVSGIGVCAVLRRYEFIQLPEVYYDRTLPVTFDPLYYLLVAVAAIVIVICACLYPSRRAARVNPLDGIRFG